MLLDTYQPSVGSILLSVLSMLFRNVINDKIDATWHCSFCQQFHDETIEQTRERIGASEFKYRQKRSSIGR